MAMDWDKLRIFYTVAQAGSFTRAGELLHTSQSAISRQICGLEESLQVSLFNRHARGLMLTEQGEILFATVIDIFSKLQAVENALTDSRERPRGALKITTTGGLGTQWITTWIGEFLDVYPEISVSLIITDEEMDLTMREADVAIRLVPPTHPDYIQRHLMELKSGIYASQKYLQKFGIPKNLAELDEHRIITYGDNVRKPFAEANWLAKIGVKGKKRKSAFKVNNLIATLRAIENNVGIASIPKYLARNSPNVIHILKDIEGPVINVFFVYTAELRNSRRIAVFRDFLMRKIKEAGF